MAPTPGHPGTLQNPNPPLPHLLAKSAGHCPCVSLTWLTKSSFEPLARLCHLGHVKSWRFLERPQLVFLGRVLCLICNGVRTAPPHPQAQGSNATDAALEDESPQLAGPSCRKDYWGQPSPHFWLIVR